MIRHNNEGYHHHAFPFKMAQSFRDNFGAIAPPQKTGSMFRIEPAFDSAGEALMILAVRFDGPRFAMDLQPILSLGLPLVA
jgi:hypothetical protein